LVAIAGGIACLGSRNQPSVGLSDNALHETQPDVLFVALCGFDLARLPGWTVLPCVRNGRVYCTDGNAYFSREGPCLVENLEILAHALHPDIHLISPSYNFAKTW
jgi:iron complex transport system substrate-binding protein